MNRLVVMAVLGLVSACAGGDHVALRRAQLEEYSRASPERRAELVSLQQAEPEPFDERFFGLSIDQADMLCDRRDDLSCKAFTICVGRYGRRAELDRIATRIKDLPRVVQDDCLESVPAQAAELMRMRAMYEARLADTINSGIRDLSINLSPPKDGCCKHCAPGSQPCGNSCISLEYKCHKPPGCACW